MLIPAVLASSFLVSGIVFGWAPLLLILRSDGTVDAVGESSLTLAYTCGVAAQTGMALVAGTLADLQGPKVTSAIGTALVCIGLVLFGAVPNSVTVPVGYSFIGGGACINYFASFAVAFIDPSRQALILSSLNALFDAASSVFYAMYLLYQYAGVSRRTLFLGYSVLVALLGVMLFVLWGRQQRNSESPEPQDQEVQELAEQTDSDDPALAPPSLEGLPIRRQLGSAQFLFSAVFGIAHILRSNIFLGTMGDYLHELGDGDQGNALTSIFSISLSCTVFAIPLISCSLERLGTIQTMNIVNVLGTVSYLPLLVKKLWWQVVPCMLYPIYRGFLYAALTTFVAQAFGPRSVGRVFGCICLMSAAFQMVQYPLVEVLAKSWGSLWISNLCLTVSIVVPMAASCIYSTHMKKQAGLEQVQTAASRVSCSNDQHEELEFKPLGGDESPTHRSHSESPVNAEKSVPIALDELGREELKMNLERVKYALRTGKNIPKC